VEVDTVGIVGAGTMGHRIAQSAATADFEVQLYDIDQAAIGEGLAAIDKSLSRLIDDGTLAASVSAVRDRIAASTDLAGLADELGDQYTPVYLLKRKAEASDLD